MKCQAIFSQKNNNDNKKFTILSATILNGLSSLQYKTKTFANTVDPDEMAHDEQFHIDLHCLPF